jgi:hypothetical protein
MIFFFFRKWIKYDATGNAKRWKAWIQNNPIEIELPLQFRSDEEVVFLS